MIHYVGALGDAEQNAYYYGTTSGIGASAHYFVDHVVRHYDVTGKMCPAPYVDDEKAWEAFKKRLTEPESEDGMKLYQYVAEMPEWARAAATKAINNGIIKMDEHGAVGVWEASLQPLGWMDRLGLLDKPAAN